MITTLDGSPLSRLAFGTMQFGGKADAPASFAMFEAAVQAGINHFDTAHLYNGGASEQLIGEFVRRDREKLVIATKVAYSGGSGRENIESSFDISRKRLGMDCVDILYLHRFDPQTPLEETLETLAVLQQRGGIRFIGVSNFAAWQVAHAHGLAAKLGTRIDIVQPMYSLVKRQAEVEIFPMCQALGIEAAPYSPLGGGLLTGKYGEGGSGRLTDDKRYAERYSEPWMHETAHHLNLTAQRRGWHPATAAVAWAMAHPMQPTPIISARSVRQLKPSLDALQFEMTDAIYAEISRLSRAPAPATDRSEEG